MLLVKCDIINSPAGVTPLEFHVDILYEKMKLYRLPSSANLLTLSSAFLIQYTCVTDE